MTLARRGPRTSVLVAVFVLVPLFVAVRMSLLADVRGELHPELILLRLEQIDARLHHAPVLRDHERTGARRDVAKPEGPRR